MTSLRAYARWANLGLILSDYTAPTPAKGQPHPLPEGIAGVMRLVEVARNDRQQALIALTGLCGLRVAEALKVQPSHFDLHDMTLTVYGKGERQRVVPVSNAAWDILAVPVTRAFTSGGGPVVGLKDRFARRVITELGVRAKLQRHIASHDLRATFATAIYDKTRDLRLVQELLGHANSATTEIYTGITLNKMREAVEL